MVNAHNVNVEFPMTTYQTQSLEVSSFVRVAEMMAIMKDVVQFVMVVRRKELI